MLKHIFTDVDKIVNVEIETTTLCNRNCIFCPLSKDKKGEKFMDESLFYKIIDELGNMPFEGYIWLNHYGEPLLDKRLPKFVKYIRRKLKNVKIGFFSNGDLLTPTKAKSLISIGLDLIRISQHDTNPSKQISELKKYDWDGKIMFQVENIKSQHLSNRCGSVQVETMYPMYCKLNGIIIRVDGDLALCCNDYYKEVKLGNIKNNTIKDIWNSKKYRKIRKDLKSGRFYLDICKKCRGEEPYIS